MRPLSSGSPPCSSATASQPPTSPAERGRSPVAPPRRPGRGRLPVRGLTDAARCPAALGAEVIKVERAPSLGEHHREIARDLGYADPDIAGLERDGVLHSAPASTTER